MELQKWTHRYRYAMQLPNFVPRVGVLLTGVVQVHRECNASEVEAIAKEESHGIFNHAKLLDVTLIEVKKNP